MTTIVISGNHGLDIKFNDKVIKAYCTMFNPDDRFFQKSTLVKEIDLTAAFQLRFVTNSRFVMFELLGSGAFSLGFYILSIERNTLQYFPGTSRVLFSVPVSDLKSISHGLNVSIEPLLDPSLLTTPFILSFVPDLHSVNIQVKKVNYSKEQVFKLVNYYFKNPEFVKDTKYVVAVYQNYVIYKKALSESNESAIEVPIGSTLYLVVEATYLLFIGSKRTKTRLLLGWCPLLPNQNIFKLNQSRTPFPFDAHPFYEEAKTVELDVKLDPIVQIINSETHHIRIQLEKVNYDKSPILQQFQKYYDQATFVKDSYYVIVGFNNKFDIYPVQSDEEKFLEIPNKSTLYFLLESTFQYMKSGKPIDSKLIIGWSVFSSNIRNLKLSQEPPPFPFNEHLVGVGVHSISIEQLCTNTQNVLPEIPEITITSFETENKIKETILSNELTSLNLYNKIIEDVVIEEEVKDSVSEISGNSKMELYQTSTAGRTGRRSWVDMGKSQELKLKEEIKENSQFIEQYRTHSMIVKLDIEANVQMDSEKEVTILPS